jgi:hypothetical protein
MACCVPAGGQSLSAAATGAKRAQRSANRREGCVCARSECLSSLFHRNVAGGTLRCQREAHGCARVAPKSTQQRGRRCATKGRSLPKAAQQGSCSMAAGDSALCLLKLHRLAWHLSPARNATGSEPRATHRDGTPAARAPRPRGPGDLGASDMMGIRLSQRTRKSRGAPVPSRLSSAPRSGVHAAAH